MHSLSRILVMFTLVVMGASCKKDSVDAPADPTCRITAFKDVQTGTNISYTYTGSQLTGISVPGGRYTIEYSNNKPSKRFLYIGQAIYPAEKHEFSYRNDGSLEKIEFFNLVNFQTSTYDLYMRYEFAFFSGMVYEVKVYSVSQNVVTLEEDYSYSTYQGNINFCHARDYFPTVETIDFDYINDNSPNFFQKGNANTLLTDIFFIDLNPLLIPLAVNKNNVTNIVSGNSITYLEYFLTDKGYLAHFNFNGGAGYGFGYDCQ